MHSKALFVIFGVGLVILGIVAIFVGPALFRPGRTDRPENSAKSAPNPGVSFREDGILHFLDPAGSPRASISVEIAETEDSRTQGLMGRTVLAPDHGMLFIFDTEEHRSFWMANTPLPLDIIFVDSDHRIVNIQKNAKPFSEESLPSTGPARYVVEVNAGFCARQGIEPGDGVQWLQKVRP